MGKNKKINKINTMQPKFLTTENLEILKQYSETQDIKLLEKISNPIVASVVNTIFKEAVRTYEEDLPLDNFWKELHTGTFNTDIELYDPDVVFWEDNGLDPWYVAITIDDKIDSELDFEYHNHVCSDLYLSEDKKLTNISCRMDVFASNETWKFKYVQVVFENVNYCFERYIEMIMTI